ncbi:protein-disulfide reductase DsbD [Colwellia psychrerythraea]|uniref:Thiol:disulfide interchange protein DsbD n=1 Tax=Colwellia psychrerythraea (strain 34H / ATCC BAA-681) TaxID=167879 RepID=DSBD_COLP3|nr:protein-disulfide reductase DsbD [Colwellia psychrerythraea]Q487R3.1 RecName: Full=Thiol:disulfide interchange protein DsbD; AltName: Full=Protein-disulfide reductase; Short=Disulfide reductase; Flags: Precursor [Colwellia psychrerythraea 34H]AAZ24775.1 thiol:disulfide interchange protein DsbD [Colwellia psychrerythraea 34H]
MKNLLSLCFLMLAAFTLNPAAAQEKQSIFDVSNSSLFSNDDEFLKVDQAFAFNFYQKNNLLEVSFDIAPEYYLYRHQFKFKGKNTQFTSVLLPDGIDHEDEFFGVQKIFTENLAFTVNLENVSNDASIKITYQGCAEKGLCYPPTSKVIKLSKFILGESTSAPSSDAAQQTNEGEVKKSEQHQLSDMLKQDSLLLTLIAFFVGGLLLSFTPCVFPMYPILTGIIVGQGEGLTTKKAFTLSFFYVQGMAITYTLLGVVVAMAGAKFQAVFQHPIVLIGLSILFIFLALSMFGVFNLALPASWQNKLNNVSNKQKGGSITGVLMMGVISGLVASPCTTAPLTGALLYISQTGDVVLGASALYALSLGMGLPLLILGSSGGKLLPKAGAWMNIIKNIFGLLLLAVPVFLLERFIPEVASQALWALLILVSASYFYVANQNHAAAQNVQQGKGFWYGLRSLVIFLMLFFGANLAYQLIYPSSNNVTNNAQHASFKQVTSLAQLEDEVKKANMQGKTVMVDLYADWCIACKEFEKYTFVDADVQKALSNSVWLQIDMTEFDSTDNAELVQHYTILGLPSILFFDLQGNELTKQRTTGFMKAAEFSAHVKSIFK